MKRHNGIYQGIYALGNIRTAHQNARKGKRHYSEVKMVDANPEKYFQEIHKLLKNKAFVNSTYEIFLRKEKGKTREIYKLPYYPDRIIHHCIMQELEPIWMKTFIRDTYASMKNRGIHDGVRRIKIFLNDAPGTKYCLKLDVRKFYPSIDHDILKAIVRHKIKCQDTLWLLDTIIDSASGVPIGNYLSQYLANLYLSYFDHWVKADLKVKYYARYCDDIVLMHSDKAFLREAFLKIQAYLADLKLDVKSNWQIFPTGIRGIDFLGYRFFGSRTLIRKSIATEFCRKADQLKKQLVAMPCDVNSAMSYYGWFVHGEASGLWKKKITTEVKSILVTACQNSVPKPIRILKC